MNICVCLLSTVALAIKKINNMKGYLHSAHQIKILWSSNLHIPLTVHILCIQRLRSIFMNILWH